MLTVEEVIEDCRSLLASPDAQYVIAGYVSQLLRERADEVAEMLGDGTESVTLYRGDDLTVVKVVMPPRYAFYPHNHLMWGVVGAVVGREDNTFYVREAERLERTGGAAYEAGQVGLLPESVIHSVRNATPTHTIGLHVYGGDLFGAPASEWDPETGVEQPYDVTRRLPLP